MANLAPGQHFPEKKMDLSPLQRCSNTLSDSAGDEDQRQAAASGKDNITVPKKSSHQTSTDSMFPDLGDEVLPGGN
jgi:hypothetical protein